MEFSEQDLTSASEWIKYWSDIFTANPGAAESVDSAFCPPEPSPDEQPAAEDPAFLARCRADFWGPNISNQMYPSRVVCWKNEAGESGTTVSALQHDKLKLKG